MVLINGIIQPQNYELIRDRIGEILYVELTNQGNLIIPNVKYVKNGVDIERCVPYDETDLPALNVVLNFGEYSNKDQTQSTGEYKFFIVGYAAMKTTQSERGDKAATYKLHKLLGLCRAILENPIYKRLGFDAPINTSGNIARTRVGTINIPKFTENEDATNTIMGYLEFFVTVPEGVILKDPVPLYSSVTEVKLYLTDKGYRWGPNGGELDHIIADSETETIYLIAD